MSLGRVLIASGTRWRRVSHPSIRSWRPISYSMLRCETMKEASVSRVTWNTVVDALTYPSSGGTHVLRRARYPQQTHFALRAQRDGASRPPRPGTDDRRDDANPRGPARSLRGLLRRELRVRHYHDLLRPLAARVLVTHPGQLRLIFRSKNKNDRNDAERLAKLLYLGETPTVHVPSPEVRTWRELINCRSQVIAKRTRAKYGVRALLRSAGVVPPRQPGLWTRKGLAWLRRLTLPTVSQQLRRDLLLEEIDTLIRQVRRIEQELNHQAQHSSAVACLRSIPGVGIRTAEAVVAFVDDPHRFSHAKAIGRYFGLVPSQDQSGDRNRLGHITREGPPVVRQLVAEATWQALRRSPAVRAYFDSAARRRVPRSGGRPSIARR